MIHNLWYLIPIFNWTALIQASLKGHIEIVRLLLSQPGIEINCQNISISQRFIKLKNVLFNGICLHSLMELLCIMHQLKATHKSFSFYYHNQALSSTSKTFYFKNHEQD